MSNVLAIEVQVSRNPDAFPFNIPSKGLLLCSEYNNNP